MAENLADRSGSLVESHKGYDPRIIFFYFAVAALLLVLTGGLAFQQLFRTDIYHERERQQNQRRILVPGPRGNIYDREGRLLVGNRARFSVTLYLDELRKEFRREYIRVRKNYRALGDKDLPTGGQMEQIARFTVVQRYLDQVNAALGREEKVDAKDLNRHFRQQLLLPYILLDDLKPEEYARLLEQLPVRSPLQVYASSTRFYPYGSAAAHTLGYVSINDNIVVDDDFPGAELTTFKMKGSEGKSGLEKQFDATIQGQTGGSIYRVDPAGYRIDPPLEKRLPVQGKSLTTSLDIDLQVAAEKAMAQQELAGAAVVIDIATGEVLTLASKPDYNLNDLSPRIPAKTFASIEEKGGWLNRAIQGVYAPGSAFKILTTIAGMRAHAIGPDSAMDCPGFFPVGNRNFPCHAGHAHGHILLREAISQSCNVFFYKYGMETTAESLATEARRFRLDRPTGIELPYETRGMIVPDAAWKRRTQDDPWVPGDTANFSIGQGFLGVTPLQMACFTASVARRQTVTTPTLLHEPNRAPLRSEPIGLSPSHYAALVQGMEECTLTGTGKLLTNGRALPRIEGLRVAGKTGTAQKRTAKGTLNFAWFICFAPVERPQIAIAVMMEGDTPDEETGGGRFAVPVAHAVLQKWWEKKHAPKPLVPSMTATPVAQR